MDKKTGYCSENGLSTNRERCESDSLDESRNDFYNDRSDLGKSSDLWNRGERKSKDTSFFQTDYRWQSKDLQYDFSTEQNPRQVLQDALGFNCVSEQDELKLYGHFNNEGEDLNGTVQLPIITACGSTTKQTKPFDTGLRKKDLALPPLTGKRVPPRRKNAVSCLPNNPVSCLLDKSSSLPLLQNSQRNSGIVNTLNACECQLVRPVEPVRSNSPKLKNYPEGLTTADRSELNSIPWLAKRSCQKSRVLRRKYDGLSSPINYGRSINKR